jgi:hypothetical protein
MFISPNRTQSAVANRNEECKTYVAIARGVNAKNKTSEIMFDRKII